MKVKLYNEILDFKAQKTQPLFPKIEKELMATAVPSVSEPAKPAAAPPLANKIRITTAPEPTPIPEPVVQKTQTARAEPTPRPQHPTPTTS